MTLREHPVFGRTSLVTVCDTQLICVSVTRYREPAGLVTAGMAYRAQHCEHEGRARWQDQPAANIEINCTARGRNRRLDS